MNPCDDEDKQDKEKSSFSSLQHDRCDSASCSSRSSPKRKKDVALRFDGLSERELALKTLPDYLRAHLDMIIIGINPGLTAAHKGHHYAGPGNHFWKCLHMSGLITTQMSAHDDYKLIEQGIGFTNIVPRTTRGSDDLTKQEIKQGAILLTQKLQTYKPKIAVFNGKGIYEVYSGKKNFHLGLQSECIEGTETRIFVMPSSSARVANLPKFTDKLPYYIGLKKLRDHLRLSSFICNNSSPSSSSSSSLDMKSSSSSLDMKCSSSSLHMKECIFPQLKSPTKKSKDQSIATTSNAVQSDILPKDGSVELDGNSTLQDGICLLKGEQETKRKKKSFKDFNFNIAKNEKIKKKKEKLECWENTREVKSPYFK